MTIPSDKDIGREGEVLAKEFLVKQGYQIVDSNVRLPNGPKGEIDFIAMDQETVCFIEVKTRRSHLYGFPEELITRRKQAQIIRLAKGYVQLNNLDHENVRFDVVAVTYQSEGQASVELMKNAFDAF